MNRGPTFKLLGVPIRVEIWFPITILLLGLNRIEGRDKPVFWLVEWFLVAAVSILVHEFGHALAYRRYRQKPAIVLWGLGGLTYGEEVLAPKRSIIVSAAGPLTGLVLLGIPGWLAYNATSWTNGDLKLFLYDVYWLNVVWSLVNLLPLLPLDGGHICESILEIVHGEPRRQTARLISIPTGFLLGVYAWISWGSAFGVFFGWGLAVMNLIGYLQVRNGSLRGMQFEFAPERPGDSDREQNVVSMDKARKKRDRRSPAELINDGYTALERRDYKAALRISDRLEAKRLNAELDRWTAELAAFAWVGERNPLKAEEVLARLGTKAVPSPPLTAVLALANKQTDAGVGLMVRTMVDEPEGGPKLVAVDLFAEYGMIHRLARDLVDLDGGQGFEAAVALESMLHRLHRTQDATTVSDVIMLG